MFDEHKEIYLFYPELRACSARLENLKTLSETTINYERMIKSKPEACKEYISRRGESFSSLCY